MGQKEEVYKQLEEMQITYTKIEHKPVYTIEEMEALHLPQQEWVIKNLFLRDDKKKEYYLVLLQKDKQVCLKELRQQLQSRPLSFASEADLEKYLGLQKGSVTPLGLLQDKEGKVTVVMDADILQFAQIGVHPNENTATVFLQQEDFQKICRKHGDCIKVVSVQ